MIKCPECGHQVSDRAPVCPSCGVQIAGHIVKCGHCGEIHLIEDVSCPNCHQPLTEAPAKSDWTEKAEWTPKPVVQPEPVSRPEPVSQPEPASASTDSNQMRWTDNADPVSPQRPQKEETEPVQQAVPVADEERADDEKPKKGVGTIVVAFLITAIVCAVMLYMYRDAQTSNEMKQYELAMKSSEPAVLQAYLDKYHDSNKEHFTEVQNKLNYLKSQKSQAEEKAQKEADDASDEGDWQVAVKENSEDSYARYKMQHPDGKHSTEADEALKTFARATIVTEDDESRAKAAIQKVLRAINSHSAEKLTEQFAATIAYNGEEGKTPQAMVDYMEHLYNNVDRLNWYTDAAHMTVAKNESQELTIMMPARISQNLKSGTNVQNHFNVHATLDTEGHIKAITFTKLAPPAEKSE